MARYAKEPDVDYQVALGDLVRTARRRAKFSQEDLAYTAGISPRHLSNIERGVTNPGAVQLAQLAIAMGIQPGSLMPRIDPQTGQLVRDRNPKKNASPGVSKRRQAR